MRQYNFLTAIPLSLFSADLYRDVARNWRGIGFWYLVLILFLTTIVPAVAFRNASARFVRDEFPKFAAKVPDITIRNGQASSPVAQPYDVKDPQTGQVIFRLDTTGRTRNLDDTEAIVLLTRDKLYTRNRQGGRGGAVKVEERSLKDFPDMQINQQKVTDLAHAVVRQGPWWIFFGYGTLKFVGYFLCALLVAAIGLAISNGMHAHLNYQQLLRITAVATTPAALLGTLLWVTPVVLPCCGGAFLPVGIMLLYVFIGVKANAGEHAQPPGGFGVQPSPGPYGYPPQPYPGAYMPPPPPSGYPPQSPSGQGYGYPPPPGPPPPYPPRQG